MATKLGRPRKKPAYRGRSGRDVHDARREALKREKADACAALALMGLYPGAGRDPDDRDLARADATARRLGMRPLKPPPTPLPDAPRRTAGALALAAERRAGVFAPETFALDRIEEQEE